MEARPHDCNSVVPSYTTLNFKRRTES